MGAGNDIAVDINANSEVRGNFNALVVNKSCIMLFIMLLVSNFSIVYTLTLRMTRMK